MIVVADTSPLNYLIQVECDTLLPRLYHRIVVPAGVLQELRHPAEARYQWERRKQMSCDPAWAIRR
jgi:predicted nucleic acid-binding protein